VSARPEPREANAETCPLERHASTHSLLAIVSAYLHVREHMQEYKSRACMPRMLNLLLTQLVSAARRRALACTRLPCADTAAALDGIGFYCTMPRIKTTTRIYNRPRNEAFRVASRGAPMRDDSSSDDSSSDDSASDDSSRSSSDDSSSEDEQAPAHAVTPLNQQRIVGIRNKLLDAYAAAKDAMRAAEKQHARRLAAHERVIEQLAAMLNLPMQQLLEFDDEGELDAFIKVSAHAARVGRMRSLIHTR
jgi:hypothetical protein